ncbi:MAG: hypothetical protein K2N38_07395 [Oscillospiraceae bacterium]|nr:hypothetical protein [Oscillospiraceae bacterium]
MITGLPYFMKNPDWYRTSGDEPGYVLTENAPPEAVKSYNEFYESNILVDENGDERLIER